jgi:hypothetical protein
VHPQCEPVGIPGRLPPLELALFVNMANMLNHIRARCLQQNRHLLLGKPQCFIFQPRFDLYAAIFKFGKSVFAHLG